MRLLSVLMLLVVVAGCGGEEGDGPLTLDTDGVRTFATDSPRLLRTSGLELRNPSADDAELVDLRLVGAGGSVETYGYIKSIRDPQSGNPRAATFGPNSVGQPSSAVLPGEHEAALAFFAYRPRSGVHRASGLEIEYRMDDQRFVKRFDAPLCFAPRPRACG